MSRRSLWRAGFRPCSAPVSTTSSSDLHIRAAVERQLAQMPHVMFGGLVHEPALTLARRLSAMLGAGLDHVFFRSAYPRRGRAAARADAACDVRRPGA